MWQAVLTNFGATRWWGRRRGMSFLLAIAALVPLLTLNTPDPASAANPCGPPVTSVIACENQQPGTPQSTWDVGTSGDATILGYTTDISTNVGGTVTFKINTPARAYTIQIYRVGYYQGNGARLIASVTPSAVLPQTQPACLTNAATGLTDCGNWAVSASWSVPSTAVSGVYFALLRRTDTGGRNQIPFVVRNDASHSDLLYQTSDTTWEAYNAYGGDSLYNGNGSTGRAYKVSYNRPFTTRQSLSAGWDTSTDNFFYGEYPTVRFLEENGYDVTYFTGVDADRNGSLIKNHKVYVTSGHDEYWSGNQRTNVEAARDAGVSMTFLSGNEVFWKTRWENSIDGSNTPYRTLVTYKETHDDAVIDPADPPTWTGTWQDPRFSPPGDGGRPQNALTGQLFTVNAGTSSIEVPAAYSKLRFWRNTSIANLQPGQVATLTTNSLGYEWDEDADNGFRPAGQIDMSSTTVSVPEKFVDYGNNVAAANATHSLTLYRAASGALVFGAGSVQWSWCLDDTHDGSGGAADPNAQQAMINLYADMGVHPATLMAGMVPATQSTVTTKPTSTISSPVAGTSYAAGTAVTITGTASASSGAVVGGVEVSTDGGTTWHPATGTTSWSYSWVATGAGSHTIRSRATDDSMNTESPGAGITVTSHCPCSIWSVNAVPELPAQNDSGAVEVGVKFRSDTFGTITGLRFYKGAGNTGTHIGNLWTSTGVNLASATFTGETASGWQSVSFASPVAIQANTTYVASYFAPAGHYAVTDEYFYHTFSPPPLGGGTVDSPPLHALDTGVDGPNSVYVYSSSSSFPNLGDTAENYWVDVVFQPASAPSTPTGVTAAAGYSSASVSWTASTTGPPQSYIVTPYIGTTAQTPTTVTGTPVPTSTVVTGLTNGQTYTFTVAASNPAGTSAPSAPSNAVTPSATASLVSNGTFESGLSGWTTGGVVTPTVSTTQSHSPTHSAFLGSSGNEPSGDSFIQQTVGIPAGTSTLSFWYYPTSTDTICSGAACVYDWEEAQIRSTTGTTLASVMKLDSNAQAWTQVTFNTSAYAGQTVVLWFNVHQDGGGDPTSIYLDDVSLTVVGPPPPGQPTGVTATAGNASAAVSWTAPAAGGSPITSYTVTPYIGSTAQSPPTVVSGSPPATNTTVTGLTNGQTYTFTVYATNAQGNGQASTASNAVTPVAPAPPGQPTSVAATAGNASAGVNWTAPSSSGGSAISSYTVTAYIGTTAQAPPTVVSGSPPATSTTVTGLTNGQTYTFTVYATNAQGNGPPSTASNAVTPAPPPPPGQPTGVTATAGNASATVSWTAPAAGGSPISSYTVTAFIGTTAQSPPTVVNGSPPATSTTVTGLTNGQPYTFTVYATNAQGNGPPSAASNTVTPAPPPPPGQPTGVTATAGNASASVSWTAPSAGGSPISSYTVTAFIGTTAQSPPTVVNGSPPATSTTVTGLTNGQTYTFTVYATNAQGNGQASAASNAVTPTAPTAPGQPTSVTATPGNASAVVSWTAPANGGSPITSYTVTAFIGSTAQSPTTVVSGSPPATSTTVTGLTNGQTYTFTVYATNAVGNSSPSAASNAVTLVANVVQNPGFESSLTSWTTGGASAPTATTAKAHSGTHSALLGVASGAEPNGDSSLSQSVVVPSGTSSLTFWYQSATTDQICSGTACQYDWEEAQIRNTSGTTLASVMKQNNNTSTWTQVTFDTSTYAGQTIVLWFNVHEDGSTPPDDSALYLDDVALMQTAAPSAPGQPTGVTATAGNASATVSWTAPSNGGSTISSYKVTPFIGTAAQTATVVSGSPPATSVSVTGLTNGTAYTFTVTATNSVGTGPPSASSNAVTPTASTNAVSNGGFESGALSPWTASGTPATTVSTAQAHTGTHSALLGTVTGGTEPAADGSLSQTITVPAGHPTLSFWYDPGSTDTICSGAACIYDWQQMQVRNTSGTMLAQPLMLCSNSQTWTQVTFDMTPYAGQTVVLWFNVHQDAGGDPTWMYLDDVSVQ